MYRGGGGFAKPENALKRAEELENVGQKQAAIQALHDVLTSKRHKTWQKAMEVIMFKYVELSVDLKAGRLLKDGLIQYRNSCQQDNVQSLEEVIKHLLKRAHEKAEQAQAQSEENELDIADLEVDATPEDLMLSYVSGDNSKDRKDRKDVMPWFKFLWETYRNVLDILRNNSRLEALYAMTAIRAYNFCATYNRTTEFKRVCEIIRNHLANLNKYADQRDKPDLQQPESLALYMETRFEQLRVASVLGLWQEAFRTVEDIHGLTFIGKRSPKPQLMAVYYAKLTQVFLISEKHLYNAYAWYKLLNISKGYNKNLQEKDVQLMATGVVLSALSVLPYDAKASRGFYEVEQEKEKAGRVANLLGFSVDSKRDARAVLSRSALLSELSSKGVLNLAIPQVQQLYYLLEKDFNPLDLCKKIDVLLKEVDTLDNTFSPASPMPKIEFKSYFKQIQHVAILKMVQQITQVYSTVKLDFIGERVPFLPFEGVEKYLVDAIRNSHLQIRIDHAKKIVSCGTFALESDKVKSHLSLLAKRFNKAVCLIQKDTTDDSKQMRKVKAVESMRQQVETEHRRILARKVIIEKRKEEYEQMLQEKEKEEENKRLQQERIRAEEEKRRLQTESAKREEERQRRDMEEQELEEARALMEAASRRGKKFDLKEGEKIDKVQLRQQAIQEQIKERQEQARKLQRLSKTMDHFERAKREEQVELLMQLHEQRMIDDEEYQKQHREELLANHKAKWAADIEEKARLSRLISDKEDFQRQLLNMREEQYRAQEEMMMREIEQKKAERKAQRILARKKEYVRRCREAEELRMKIEEEERIRAEQEMRRKAEEERMRVLDEQLAKQRAREAEIDQRRAAAYQVKRGDDKWARDGPRQDSSRWERGDTEGDKPQRAFGGTGGREDRWGDDRKPRGFGERKTYGDRDRRPPSSYDDRRYGGKRPGHDQRGPPGRGDDSWGRSSSYGYGGPNRAPPQDKPSRPSDRKGFDKPRDAKRDDNRW